MKEELGSIEAPWILKCTELGPFVVDMDSKGNNLFDTIDDTVELNRQNAFSMLGIDEEFKPTKLYGVKRKTE